jgi:CheY-like chemotaxis protein
VRILLADDSVTAQNMGKKILSEAGHEVVCVSNGAAALKKATEEEPDLVILDIYMPGYSGLEVCQRLRENPATANLPVVLTVGKLEPFRKEDAQRVRAEALIVKPFEASELAAAVARFGEIVAAASPKGKSKGKLGPQAKAKPQWDEGTQDEFVTTTQKLEEEGYVPSSANVAGTASETPEAAAKPQPAVAAGEFEVVPAPQATDSPAVSHDSTDTARGSFGAEADSEVKETSWPASASAAFTVQAEETVSASDQLPTVVAKAAAAAAGADFSGASDIPEPPTSGSPAQDFEVAAPSEASVPEPSFFSSQVAADAPSLPGAPDLSLATTPEVSAAAAEPYAPPATDPAFEPDRTQWATHFPTHFGIQEEEAATEAEAPAIQEPAIQEPESEAPSTPPDEIAAILSNLPGGGSASQATGQSEEVGKFGERPWPLEAPSSGRDGWKAEEVPVEDGDSSVSLADEMEKVSAASAAQPESPNSAEPEVPASREEVHPARIVESSEEESQPAPATMEVAQANAASASSPADSRPAEAAASGEQKALESTLAQGEPDRLTGVMQSAAMAIATRATVSAVASQLHQPAPESTTTGPSAIEELVGQVLERLKPKLIAEIKRELKATEEE